MRSMKEITLPGEITNFEHSKCYCGVDQNCSQEISREHWIPNSILKRIDGGVNISGPKWLGGKSKQLPTGAMASNTLCRRHNSALHVLDDLHLEVFKLLSNAADKTKNSQIRSTFSGNAIERYLLKVLCSHLVSDGFDVLDKLIRNWKPPSFWLEILFGREEMPKDWGFYGVTPSRLKENFPQHFPARSPIRVLPTYENGGLAPHGLVVSYHGIPFVLAMHEARQSNGLLFDSSIYRPARIVIERPGSYIDISLDWLGGYTNGTYRLTGRDEG